MRYRLPAAAVLGVVTLLCAGAAVLGVATSSAAVSSPASFAHSVLAQAVVPPGEQPATVPEAEENWLDRPDSTPGVQGLVDVHAFYLYDEPPQTVTHFVTRHLPPGANVVGAGSATGIVPSVTVSVPISGPNEYLATLTYTAAPTNWTLTRSELRIDAETVWVPSRSALEQAPGQGVVKVTGYQISSPRTGARGPVSVLVSSPRARDLIQDLNALPLGAQVSCHDSAPLWTVSVSRSAGAPPAFVARDEGCAGSVAVTMSGRAMPVLLSRGCTILRDVAALLPPRARATRSAAAKCELTRVDERPA